ncbi:hypothetical protein LJ737_06250 [Hymenobacter sp. 15J16-1T3B]|uniref:tail fiber domain-containing protein n=1 Tax=Hymenobacter sp. 15J16-1T3B TaxID=2886941 RepID=UPI001D12BA2A|nr:tail fiber domain-containing protein [Hymenobacter sp. 15J16-1T3B]MCC3156828.1 hypothetical protein [Hymenobacter sp. 15J16-1T3B]
MTNFSALFRASLCGLALLPAAALAQTPDTLLAVYSTASSPKPSRLSVHKNGALLAGGEFNGGFNGGIPAEGSGTRLLWYPDKAAFRAGYINGTQWDDANVGSYSNALGYNSRASGDYSFAAGKDVVAANVGTVALGEFCTAVGANSVALGYYANTRTSAGSPRLGTFVFSDRSVPDDGDWLSDESFNAETTNAAHWRVTNGFRIYTSSDRSTGIIFQSGTQTAGNTPSWYQANAVISSHTGAYLSSGGVWTSVSDRHKKHLFEAVSGEEVLRRLRQVPITRWSYKAETGNVRHLGPMAQDFRRAFGLGPDSVSIGSVDADGVALAGVQALDARTRALQAENAQLRARLAALEQVATHPSAAGLPLNTTLLALGAGLLAVLLLRRRPTT